MFLRRFCSICILVLSILVLPTPFQFSIATAEEDPSTTPDAADVMRQTREYIASLKEFSFHADSTDEQILSTGQKVQYGSSVDLSVKRPDRFLIDSEGELQSPQLFYDGTTMTLYGKKVNQYTTVDAGVAWALTIDDAIDYALDTFGLPAPLFEFINRNSYMYTSEDMHSGIYVGLSKVGGVECHQLAFSEDDMDWEIWIENSKTPVPRKLIVTNTLDDRAPQFTALFTDWNVSPHLHDSLFNFIPPIGAEKINLSPAD